MYTYNAKNRMSGDCDTLGDTLKAWQFTYDGDGTKVKQEYTDTTGTLTTFYYAGGSYEVQTDGSTETVRQYYALAGVTVGMREGSTFFYFLTDHLGSVVGVTDSTGAMVSETRYLPFGEVRTGVGNVTQTDYGYTFQKNDSYIKLLDYRFRSYSTELGRFVSPDSIVPNLSNPQSLNRYSYVNNRPINFNDPSGQMQVCADGDENEECGFGSDPNQILAVFTKSGNYNGLYAQYYATLAYKNIDEYNHKYDTTGKSQEEIDIENEALDAEISSIINKSNNFLPQQDFDPLAIVDPVSIYGVSNVIVGLAKDAVYSGIVILA